MVTVVTSCGSSKTIAIEDGWDLLGEEKVNFVRDRDQIKVYNQTLYTAVKFQMINKDVHLNNVAIVYPNGDKLNPSVDEDVAAGGYSKEIEVDILGKEIRTIEFSYRSKGNLLKGRARVLVFGKRALMRQQY
jgi:hypothetical protein